MSKKPRRNRSPAFKAKVALDAIRRYKTLAALAKLHDVHPNQITDWTGQLLSRATWAEKTHTCTRDLLNGGTHELEMRIRDAAGDVRLVTSCLIGAGHP